MFRPTDPQGSILSVEYLLGKQKVIPVHEPFYRSSPKSGGTVMTKETIGLGVVLCCLSN
jgi:hypothetical protein